MSMVFATPPGLTRWAIGGTGVFPAGLAHRLLLNPSHGHMLTELAEAAGAELVWAERRWLLPERRHA
jgi:hypothetical protein